MKLVQEMAKAGVKPNVDTYMQVPILCGSLIAVFAVSCSFS